MTGSGRTENEDDRPNPWARGGTMRGVPPRVSDAEFSFTAIETPAEHSSGTSAPDGRNAAPTTAPAGTAGNRRRAWFVSAAFVAATAGGVTVLTDGEPDGEAAGDAAPPAAELVDDTSGPVEQLPAITAPRATPPPLLADKAAPTARSADAPDALVATDATREFVVDIAAALDTINPTEVVALDANGAMYEVSLPSGRVRVTDVGFATDRSELVANDHAAVIWPTPEGGAQIISTQRSAAVPAGDVDRVSWSPATNRFYLWSGRSFDNGYRSSVTEVQIDPPEASAPASIRWEDADWVTDADDPATLLDADGALLRTDTGGTYRVTAEGTELVTTGDVVAIGANHLLLRECDTGRRCSLISQATDGTRRTWPADLPDKVTPQPVAGLSPGGDALLVLHDRIEVDTPSDLQVLELVDGSLRSLRAAPNYEGAASWDTTGAGVFYADLQLLYLDRFTGEATVVSADLPRLRSVASRRPASSPVCELLGLVVPRFAEMSAGGDDNTIGPPPTEVLDRLLTVAPDELSAEAETLVRFVSNFVSPEVADSQTVANWPTEVTAGLDAARTYAGANCPFVEQ